MRQISISIVVLALNLSCSSAQEVITKSINLTVIDEKRNTPVDSAQVIFTSIVETKDIHKVTRYTNSLGQCTFSFEYKQGTSYEIWARKRGYFRYLTDDAGSVCKSNISITDSTKEKITLYVTSDPLQNSNYWKQKAIRYNIDTLIQLLRENQYYTVKSFGLPLLIWEDIPKLLEISDDTTLLTSFPRNGISSYMQKECYLGVISMWLIESIRITEEKGIYDPFENYPSLNPIIRQKNRKEFSYATTNIKEMRLASHIYMDWWKKVEHLNNKEACKTDPFRNADIGW